MYACVWVFDKLEPQQRTGDFHSYIIISRNKNAAGCECQINEMLVILHGQTIWYIPLISMNEPNYKFGLCRCFQKSEDSYVKYCNTEGITCMQWDRWSEAMARIFYMSEHSSRWFSTFDGKVLRPQNFKTKTKGNVRKLSKVCRGYQICIQVVESSCKASPKQIEDFTLFPYLMQFRRCIAGAAPEGGRGLVRELLSLTGV